MYKINIFLILVIAFSLPLLSNSRHARGGRGNGQRNTIQGKRNKIQKKKSKNLVKDSKSKKKKSISEGSDAHPFTLMSIKRRFKSLKKIISLNKDKDIFLIFFTTSCKSCVKERAKIIEMTKTNPQILPILIGVRNPKDETISEFNSNIKRIIKDEDIKFDVYLDLYSTVAKFYKVKEGTSITVPKLFIVNSNSGKIVKIVSGYNEKLPELYKNLYKKN